MKNLIKKSTAVLLVSAFSFAAHAADEGSYSSDLSFSAGVRLWSNQWQANSDIIPGSNHIIRADSNTKLVAIPVFSVRYQNFGASFSYFANTKYNLFNGANTNSISRSESDINLSYSLLPGLSASLGYKSIEWGNVSIKGPILGVSASAPIGSGFGVYGTTGFGWLKTKAGVAESSNTDYALGDLGLSYSIDTSSTAVKGLTATVGYRFQNITAKKLINGRDFKDTTSGLTIGLIGSF